MLRRRFSARIITFLDAADGLADKLTAVDVAAETAQVLEFLGLPWDSRCLRFHEPGVATSAADTPLRRPVDDRDVGCWEHYREPLARFAGQLPLEEYEHGGF